MSGAVVDLGLAGTYPQKGMSRHPRIWPRKDPRRPASWDDLDEVPEDYVGEIVNGEIVVTPRPNAPHMKAAGDLRVELAGPFLKGIGGPGGWVIYEEPRIRFGEDIRVPDLAGWRRERWTTPNREGPIDLVPDWVCEVLSRATVADDRSAKLPLYARAGVGHAWLLDPETFTLEVYRRQEASWLLLATHAGNVRVRAEPFDAVELDLSLLWLPPQ